MTLKLEKPSLQTPLLTLLIFGLCLIGAEAALQITREPLTIDDQWENHPVLGYMWRPDQRNCLPPEVEGYHGCYETNGAGFIIRPTPQAAEQTILLLGDSLVESLQVAPDENMSAQLESRLAVRVVNLGISGYAPVQYLLAYRQFADVFAPDVVVVAFTVGNDFTDDARLHHDGRIVYDQAGIPVAVKPTFDYDAWTYWTNSDLSVPMPNQRFWGSEALGYAYRAGRGFARKFGFERELGNCYDLSGALTIRCDTITNRENTLLRNNSAAVYNDPLRDEDQADIARTLGFLRILVQEVHADGRHFVLLMLPDATQVPDQLQLAREMPLDETESTAPQMILMEFCEQEQVTCVDPLPLFLAHSDTALVGQRDVHYTPAGHALIAQALADALAQESPE